MPLERRCLRALCPAIDDGQPDQLHLSSIQPCHTAWPQVLRLDRRGAAVLAARRSTSAPLICMNYHRLLMDMELVET